LQVTEEEVKEELSFDKKTGKEKNLPHPRVIREIVKERIAERRHEINGTE